MHQFSTLDEWAPADDHLLGMASGVWLPQVPTIKTLESRLFDVGFGVDAKTSGPVMISEGAMSSEPLPAGITGITMGQDDRVGDDLSFARAALGVLKQSFSELMPMTVGAMHRFIAQPGIHLFVAWSDDGPVTAASVVMHDQHAAIFLVATITPQRHHGYGTWIARYATRWARERAHVVTLQTAVANAGLYHRIGFREIGSYLRLSREDGA